MWSFIILELLFIVGWMHYGSMIHKVCNDKLLIKPQDLLEYKELFDSHRKFGFRQDI